LKTKSCDWLLYSILVIHKTGWMHNSQMKTKIIHHPWNLPSYYETMKTTNNLLWWWNNFQGWIRHHLWSTIQLWEWKQREQKLVKCWFEVGCITEEMRWSREMQMDVKGYFQKTSQSFKIILSGLRGDTIFWQTSVI
jgi:hypothetical protein